ncbi:uncharacterized protein STEHIDRAFT_117057 [Stereum hirsutum FP-91666 SS1]|uniref:uncharacterized protein n=1 Tax=Stereum hirsutum (strain FP-91666) TaxID=721885 RepID=UPI00044100C4|nr:uncharacterized protein STEHIDRAFT_117057 [Stereum hirsutum FP-91666 SS1]EIM91942.1 hypothetical protein STEHIDRAFT_117057 [Stereum hirsutum FP-91666 SS1]
MSLSLFTCCPEISKPLAAHRNRPFPGYSGMVPHINYTATQRFSAQLTLWMVAEHPKVRRQSRSSGACYTETIFLEKAGISTHTDWSDLRYWTFFEMYVFIKFRMGSVMDDLRKSGDYELAIS